MRSDLVGLGFGGAVEDKRGKEGGDYISSGL